MWIDSGLGEVEYSNVFEALPGFVWVEHFG